MSTSSTYIVDCYSPEVVQCRRVHIEELKITLFVGSSMYISVGLDYLKVNLRSY